MLVLVLLALLNALTPWHDWHVCVDKRWADGERYWSVCAWRFQRAETMACVEVPHG